MVLNKNTMYLAHHEIIPLVRDADWETLSQTEIETERGTVRNSVKSLEGALKIAETLAGTPGFSQKNLDKFRELITAMKSVSTRGRRPTKIMEGDRKIVRLLSRQGQASVPFVGDYFEYMEHSDDPEGKHPYTNMYVRVEYRKNKIIISPVPPKEWSSPSRQRSLWKESR
jgi:hypothetical protein